MPFAENAPENESPEREVSPETSAEQERRQNETEAAAPVAEQPSGPTEPDDMPAAQGEAPAASEQKTEQPLSRKEILERESGVILWLTLAISAGGLLLMLPLPWVNVYYPNVTQAIAGVEFGTIELPKDEVVHLSLQGAGLLSIQLWPQFLPLLGLFVLAALLWGAAIYWRQTRFTRVRLARLVLALGLLVGIGFPVELGYVFAANQRVVWSNDQATIEDNQGIRSYDSNAAQLFLCPPEQQQCSSHYIKNAAGKITFILNAGVDWQQITAQHATLVTGHADSVRASADSSTVTTSGFAIGTFGDMGTGIGYWGAWIFSLWTLINALILLRRLRRARASG